MGVFIPKDLRMVAGGIAPGYSWQVLTEPGNEIGAAFEHEETAAAYLETMPGNYAVFQYSMAHGKCWMEIERHV